MARHAGDRSAPVAGRDRRRLPGLRGAHQHQEREHEVWLLSSLAFLAVVWGMWAMDMRVPETRALTVVTPWTRRAVSLVFFVPQQVALVLVVLGLLPDQEPALCLTAAWLLLVFAATFLLGLALPFGRPRPASEVAPRPA